MDDKNESRKEREEEIIGLTSPTSSPSIVYKSYALVGLAVYFSFIGLIASMYNSLEKNSSSGPNSNSEHVYKKIDTLGDYNQDGHPEFKANVKGKGIDTLVSHVDGKDSVFYEPIKEKDYENFEQLS